MADMPRRAQVGNWTVAETEIANVIRIVEMAGAHPLLTDAVVLLGMAREAVADYVDSDPRYRYLGMKIPAQDILPDVLGALRKWAVARDRMERCEDEFPDQPGCCNQYAEAEQRAANALRAIIEQGEYDMPEKTAPATPIIPSPGRIVHYKLTEADAQAISLARLDSNGARRGNSASANCIYPAMIVCAWGTTERSAVNLQVFLDGNDMYWATSRQQDMALPQDRAALRPGSWMARPRV